MNAAMAQAEAFLIPRPANSEDERPAGENVVPPAGEDVMAAISFTLSGRKFAIEIPFICEIASKMRTTPVPGVPPYVKGIYDLRGQLLPVFDLRSLLGLPKEEATTPDWALVIGHSQPEFLILSESLPEMIQLPLREVRHNIAVVSGAQDETEVAIETSVHLLDGRSLLSDPLLFIGGGKAGDVDFEERESVP